MNERLQKLIERGHGNCFEAIKLEPDVNKRIQKIKQYIDTRPNSTQLRRAFRLLDELEENERRRKLEEQSRINRRKR